MQQYSETEAQDMPGSSSQAPQEQEAGAEWYRDERQISPQWDVFRAEALQYYLSEKREPVSPTDMALRFSLLLWLILTVLLLCLVLLGVLLMVLTHIPLLSLDHKVLLS